MSFEETYRSAVTINQTQAEYPPNISPACFAGTFYELSEETCHDLPTILAGGTCEIFSGCTLSINPMDCHLLLYTKEGCGTLDIWKKSSALEEGKLLYLDCSQSAFTVSPTSSPWRFTAFWIQGEILSYYESLFPVKMPLLTSISPYSSLSGSLEQLLGGGTDANLYNKLMDARILTDILTTLFLDVFSPEAPTVKCAPYLLEIRRYLDSFFMNPLRLEDLEKRYHMSKYRICHEFSDAFGTPPLKYLNKKRLAAAASLLLSTDLKVHEIALEVGFENTNHFINLFKRQTGMTPLVYRDTHRKPTV